MIDGFIIALLTLEFGQVWAMRVAQNFIPLCKAGLTKSYTTLGNMEVLENRIAYNFG